MGAANAGIDATPAAGITGRVKGILLRPKQEWQVIEGEPATAAGLYKGYVLPLAAIGPVAGVIGGVVFGITVPLLGTVRVPITTALTGAVVTYVLTLVGTYVAALVIDALAPTFSATRGSTQALKVAVYGSTASWVAGIFGILPALGVLSILGLYSLYLIYLGLPVLMKVPAGKALPYTAAIVVVQIVVYLLIGVVAGSLVSYS